MLPLCCVSVDHQGRRYPWAAALQLRFRSGSRLLLYHYGYRPLHRCHRPCRHKAQKGEVNTGHSLAACKGGICDYHPRSDDVREKTADLESRARDCREFEIPPAHFKFSNLAWPKHLMISNSKIIVIWSSTVTDNQKTLSLLISLQIQSIFTPVFTFPIQFVAKLFFLCYDVYVHFIQCSIILLLLKIYCNVFIITIIIIPSLFSIDSFK